jgi:F-type H+-transporting ATPase subunit a
VAKLEDHLPYALRQFESEIIVPLTAFGWDVSFTTGSSAKLTTVLAIIGYLYWAGRERAVVPGRFQASAELAYGFVHDTVTRIAGAEAKPLVPFVFTVSIFVLVGTLLGLTPIKETFTSHLAVTLGLSLLVFIYWNVIAFRRQGLGFLRMFWPAGVPIFVAPVLVFVEVVSYLFRPITLGFRLFANIFAGHVMLKLFADFCTMMIEALGPTGVIAAIGPVLIMVVLYVFEIMIVCIQTYIFMLIASIYLKDALHGH